MNAHEIISLRLQNQQIISPEFQNVGNLVSYMGAVQAQDLSMAKWALGSRIPDTTEDIIDKAISTGEIIRTHLMRPTWHFVAGKDIYWMLSLTAPQILSSVASSNRNLGLTDDVIEKAQKIIVKQLSEKQECTRKELTEVFESNGIPSGENRPSHLFMIAELDGLICSGSSRGNQTTFSLLANKVPVPTPLSREEGLYRLASKYFTSHGPATLRDFYWWSGLPMADIRTALESIRSELRTDSYNSEEVYYFDSLHHPTSSVRHLWLLPAYDEYLISYTDRSAALLDKHRNEVIYVNGLFRPIVVKDGKVTGMWTRNKKKNILSVSINMFDRITKADRTQIEKQAVDFGKFFSTEVDLII